MNHSCTVGMRYVHNFRQRSYKLHPLVEEVGVSIVESNSEGRVPEPLDACHEGELLLLIRVGRNAVKDGTRALGDVRQRRCQAIGARERNTWRCTCSVLGLYEPEESKRDRAHSQVLLHGNFMKGALEVILFL